MSLPGPGSKTFWKLILALGILGVSFAAVLIVMADSDPIVIAAYRMLFAVLIIAPFAIALRRKELLSLKAFDLAFLSFIGVVLAVHFALWNTSLTFTKVAPSTLIVTSHPIFVALVSHYLFKERLNKVQAAGIALAFGGVVVLVSKDLAGLAFTSDHFIGCVLAFVAGLAAGVYYLSGRKMRKRLSLLTYVFVVYSVCTAALFVAAFAFQLDLIPNNKWDWLIFLLLALLPTLLGHTIHNLVLKHLEAFIISVSLLGEPVGAAILAVIFFGSSQFPSALTIAGGVIIIAGIFITMWGKKDEGSERKGASKAHG